MDIDSLKQNTEFLIESEEQLRSCYGDTHEIAIKKSLGTLDRYCREFILRSPFLCLSTQHENGSADVSPRGDPSGFVKVIDDKTIAIPDRPGNNRLDSLSNIVSNPSVGLLFIVPGFEDTLRVNGRAFLSRDPELLASLAVNNRTPTLAIVVDVHEAFLHCAKAFRRSKLWRSDSHHDRKELPSLPAMVTEQISGEAVEKNLAEKMGDDIEKEYQATMY